MKTWEKWLLGALLTILAVAAALAQVAPWTPLGFLGSDTGFLASTSAVGSPPDPGLPPTNNLALWLDAGWGVKFSSGSSVINWTNRIKTTDVLSSTNASREPAQIATGLNGLPTMDFDGTDAIGTNTIAGLNLSHPYTCLVVCKRTADVNGATIFDSYSTANRLRLQYRTTLGDLNMQNFVSAGTNALSTWYFNFMIFDNGGSGNFTFSTNNGANRVFTGTGVTTAPTGIMVGAQTDGASSPFTGEIAELLIYQGAMGSTDEASLKSYIGTKYNLP